MPLYDIPKLVTGGGFEPPMFTTWVRVLQTRVFDQLDKTLPLNHLQNLPFRHPSGIGKELKNVLACVCSLKVISNQVMPPNQFHNYSSI